MDILPESNIGYFNEVDQKIYDSLKETKNVGRMPNIAYENYACTRVIKKMQAVGHDWLNTLMSAALCILTANSSSKKKTIYCCIMEALVTQIRINQIKKANLRSPELFNKTKFNHLLRQDIPIIPQQRLLYHR